MNYAIIPARGGSKSIHKKNLALLAGKPLLQYTIEAAQGAQSIDEVYVSSEDDEILELAQKLGARLLRRPVDLAQDLTSSVDVAEHFLKSLESVPQTFTLLQPTSPLRSSKRIDDAFKKFQELKCESLFSVTQLDHHPFKSFKIENEKMVPLTSFGDLGRPRQELPVYYRANGAIYINDSARFLRKRSFVDELTFPYPMTQEESVDIDTAMDLSYAAFLI